MAAAHDAEVAEVFGTMGQGDWIGDCLHLTDSGHDVVEAAFLAAIDD